MPRTKKKKGKSDVRVFSMPKPTKRAQAIITKKSSSEAKKTVSHPMKQTKREWHIGMQLLIAGSAVAVLMILGIVDRVTFSTLGSLAEQPMPATIGIEHQNPVRLSIIIARKNDSGHVSIVNQSDELIHISVPSGWYRQEVSGAPLTSVVQDIPVLGFTRWTMPGHAGIKMFVPNAPAAFFFDSSSESSAEVDLQTIDLNDSSTTSRVLLLKDKALARLWGNDE